MAASALLAALGDARLTLKSTVTVGGTVDLHKLLATEPAKDAGAVTRDYFFAAGVDKWYGGELASTTFDSAFTGISDGEAAVILRYWHETGCRQESTDCTPVAIPTSLSDLVERVDAIIRDKYPTGAFVKLSTRSPKDSKTLFRKAEAAFRARLAAAGGRLAEGAGNTEDNARLVAFSEEMVKAAIVRSGSEAVVLLLDSWRVAEDLQYAFIDTEGKAAEPISLVVRGWDDRIRPQCEFRAFVWEGRLTCIGQYWHSLYFPELEALREAVARDCRERFESSIRAALPVPTAMLDLAWMGPGDVILVEINPLMEGLGSFKGSTGLFDFYGDADLLAGRKPFELRLRSAPEERAELMGHMSTDWRRVVFGF